MSAQVMHWEDSSRVLAQHAKKVSTCADALRGLAPRAPATDGISIGSVVSAVEDASCSLQVASIEATTRQTVLEQELRAQHASGRSR